MDTQTGLHIREIREQRDISIEQLATVLKVTPAHIQAIEDKKIIPAASELLNIASALGTDIAALISGKEFAAKKALVTRHDSRIKVKGRSSFTYESLAPYYSGRHVEPFVIEVYAQPPEKLEYSRHIGEEFHYVLEGKVSIIVDKEEHFLSPGDSIYFDSSLPHALNAVNTPARLISGIYNGESMLQLTRSKFLRDLIHTAKMLGGRNIAVVCPDTIVMRAVNKGIEEQVITTAYLVGDKKDLSDEVLIFSKHYEFVACDAQSPSYFQDAAKKGVNLIRDGSCQMIMKGQINTAAFIKAVLHKQTGITTGRRLSLISIFELPDINRLIFLTDPGINPALVSGNDLESSVDIIKNAIEVARSMGVTRPKVALLEANEEPSDKIPATIIEKQLSEMAWENADVYGPLSYDLALYEEAGKKKGLPDNPVVGNADILVVPHISGGNFLYKAWAMTMHAEGTSIVVGAQAPLIMTSRTDSDKTKFLTICVCSVYSEYLAHRSYSEDI